MKLLNKILPLLFLSLALFSCGDDDNNPVVIPETVTKSYTHRIPIKVFKEQQPTITTELTLEDIIPEKSKYFISGKFQNTGNYLGVLGVRNFDEDLVLKNFVVKITTESGQVLQQLSLGDCKLDAVVSSTKKEFPADLNLSYDEYLNLFKATFDGVTRHKKIKVVVSFTSNRDIYEDDNVYFDLNIAGSYTYNTYPLLNQ